MESPLPIPGCTPRQRTCRGARLALPLGLLLLVPNAARADTDGSPTAPAGIAAPAPVVASAATGVSTAAAPVLAEKSSAEKKPSLVPFGSLRLRSESWDWFGDFHGKDRYTFLGSLLRVGAAYTSAKNDLTLELEQPTLLGLPKDASLLPPFGQLGAGASYRDANGGQEASLFIKQAFWRYKGLGGKENSLKLGRFEVIDGTETTPKDSTLAALKRERIAHRLIGNFVWSDVQRSFDGGQFVHDTPAWNVTAFAGMPTQGAFSLDGATTMADVKVGYAAVTHPMKSRKFASEARLFGLYYLDERDGVIKTDNRALPDRTLDQDSISIATVGGHWIGAWDTPGGKIDGLVWGAGQWGDWGKLSHGADAYAAEVGFQPKALPGKPWFRAGYSHFSGDGDPSNSRHGTFFPVLPTPRVYARFPFYTEANLNDGFVEAMFRPHPKVTLRSDIHFLTLADPNDLWYSGGGAFQNTPSFGYAGRPSNGKTDLGTLYDVSVDWRARKYTTVTGYLGFVSGGDVILSNYGKKSHGFLGYLELTQRW